MLWPARLERDRSMKLDYLLDWTVNIFIVAVLPVRIGLLGAPLWFFLTYAATAGVVLTLVDDVGYAREIFSRSDIRSYLKVRIAIIAILGIAPFLSGCALAW